MKPPFLFFSIGVLLLLVPNAIAQDSDHVFDTLAMKLTNRLLRAFDTRNYTGFTDFDVNFKWDDCFRDKNQTEFLKAVAAYRNTFSSGTVIKFGFISAQRIIRQYDGILFHIHFEFLGQHHDVEVNFLRIRLTTGSLWRWVFANKSNCSSDRHKTKVFTDDNMLTKVLS